MIGKKYFVDKVFMRRLGAKEVLELSRALTSELKQEKLTSELKQEKRTSRAGSRLRHRRCSSQLKQALSGI